uniref:G-protein coupled receptors family 1 profile domain-containing protein n=1 Tax=Acrobeloides nanus TaxID=290746 RepID=A0A914C1F3_9BILA
MTVFSTLPINLTEPLEIVLAQSEIQWRHPALAFLMASFCIITVTGNCLVVAAVCTKRYLRNPTGYLIVSLAVADLIVGLIVMPLNSLFEMTRHVWLLGLTMCDLFHALDILASTSSIWNLCVISLDRYMAGQDPIGYRDKVSTKRIMIAIFFVWIMSACLSFPAIIFWRNTSPHLYTDQSQCLFTDSRLYVVFSSLVSFYIPLCLILYAYGSVYLIATRHSRSVKRGMKKVTRRKKRKTDSDRKGSEEHGTALRIHVGRAKQGSIVASLVGAATANAAVPHRAYGSFYVARQLRVPGDNDPSNNKSDKQQLSNKPSSPLSRHASFVTPNTAPPTYSNSSEIPLLKPDSSSCVDSWSTNRHKTSSDSNASTTIVNGNGKVLNRLSSSTSITTPENGGDLPNGISARSQKVLMKRLGSS